MDDKNFDDILKKKLGGYEDPTFDQEALDSLNAALAGVHRPSWYAQYSTRFAVGIAALLITAFNVYLFWDNIHYKKTAGKADTVLVVNQSEAKAIDSLRQVILHLQTLQHPRISAAPVTTIRQPSVIRTFSYRLTASDSVDRTGIEIELGAASDIPVAVYNRLKDEGLLVTNNGKASMIVLPDEASFRNNSQLNFTPSSIHLAAVRGVGTLKFYNTPDQNDKKLPVIATDKGVTMETRDALEKHYFNSLGIELGAHVDAVQGIFSTGTGAITPRIGISANWIVSPHWSVETGIDYFSTAIHSAKNARAIVDTDEHLGDPLEANLRTRLFSVPVSLRYRQWISDKNQFIVKVGYTPFVSIRNELTCDYSGKNSGYPSYYGNFTTIIRQDAVSFYGSTIGVSGGITHNLKNRKFETLLFYEHALGGVGTQNFSMQLAGVRVAYWFKVR